MQGATTTNIMTESRKKIVVVGGSHASLKALTFLLQHADRFDIVWVSPSTHMYWNFASPRLLIEPEHFDVAAVSLIEEAKKHSNLEFINAKVTHVDFDAKCVSLDSQDETLSYDYIIITSGSRAHNPVFKLGHGSFDETETTLKSLHEQIKEASTVAVVGGGATGVETCAEIAYAYKNIKVTLYTGSSGPLSEYGAKTTSGATRKLTDLNINIVNNVFTKTVVDTDDGKKLVTLADGSSATFDVVIFATGAIPNTEFMDSSLLTDGYVTTDRHFRIVGKEGAYALGDVVSMVKNKTVADIKVHQLKAFQSALTHDLIDSKTKEVEYNPDTSALIVVPISRQGGVGLIFGWAVPSFVVRILKAKDFMLSKAHYEMTL